MEQYTEEMWCSFDTTIYIQIADDIRSRILSEELEADDSIMSTTQYTTTSQYATTSRINPATANEAFNELVAQGSSTTNAVSGW